VIRLIRYLAATDDTPTGALALEYLKALLRIAPVRVGSMSGGLSGKWEVYTQLLVTPMQGDFVNVVCCDPARWSWEQKVPMPKRLTNGELVLSGEVATGRQELYTEGCRNVLLTDERYEHKLTREQTCTALRYQEIVVSDHLSQALWASKRWMSDRMVGPTLIPVPVTNHNALRAVVLPPRS
jgi:hypothetical protein